MERLTLDEMRDRGLPGPKRLLVIENGGSVSTITPLGVTEESYPTFSLNDCTMRIEEKDIEWRDGAPSIDGELRFLVIDEGTDL